MSDIATLWNHEDGVHGGTTVLAATTLHSVEVQLQPNQPAVTMPGCLLRMQIDVRGIRAAGEVKVPVPLADLQQHTKNLAACWHQSSVNTNRDGAYEANQLLILGTSGFFLDWCIDRNESRDPYSIEDSIGVQHFEYSHGSWRLLSDVQACYVQPV